MLSPSTQISCAYSGDGGTANPRMCCGGCDPSRSFAPEALESMLTEQQAYNARGYNEVVVSSYYWTDHLPGIIEAFISGHGGNDISYQAHQAFLAMYNLDPMQVPLIGLV